MRGSYETIKTTTIACAVLHNLAIKWKDIDEEGKLTNINYIFYLF